MPNTIELIIHDDLNSYRAAVVPFLEMEEAENSLFLGTLMSLRDDSPAPSVMAEARRNSEPVAAAFYDEVNLIVARGLEPAMRPLTELLKARQIDVPGVVGPAEVAEVFAAEWTKTRGCRHLLAMDQGIYRLTEVHWPKSISGNMCVMTEDHADLISEWIQAFQVEALPDETHSIEQSRKHAETRLRRGMTFLWQVEGRAVSMASLSRPTSKGVSVNAVYTTPQERNRGYASALVAAVSQEGLRSGKEFCVLYTDLTNPTSNWIYQKIGYRFVARSRNFKFVYRD
jgi:uncharacterized protein